MGMWQWCVYALINPAKLRVSARGITELIKDDLYGIPLSFFAFSPD